MDRNVMTQNCILQFDMIRVRGGIIEPLPKLFYLTYIRRFFHTFKSLPGEIFLCPKKGVSAWNAR